MGLLERANSWLESQRLKSLSVPAIYISRDGEIYKVKATLGKTLFRVENEYGITVRIESRDFLVSAKELPKDPESGDKIFYSGREYEVLAPNSESVWRWSGTTHLTRRIHTKEIGEHEQDY